MADSTLSPLLGRAPLHLLVQAHALGARAAKEIVFQRGERARDGGRSPEQDPGLRAICTRLPGKMHAAVKKAWILGYGPAVPAVSPIFNPRPRPLSSRVPGTPKLKAAPSHKLFAAHEESTVGSAEPKLLPGKI